MSNELNYASYKKLPDADFKKMIIDGKEVPFLPGDTIMQAAERSRIAEDIPRFCYHPGLPVAGTCRMCTVEVEKMPKLMTSCSTPAAEGMVVHTQSEKVKKSRTGVMEFLLANHPLDCPVCDKAGECELQDYNYEYGPAESRFREEKRVWSDATTKKLSDRITLNMNRCVHCERCVRFTDEVTKTHDLVMLNRGWKKELAATDEQRGLWNDYQGCLADFCPVGALTFTDFRFQKRVWFLDKKNSICDGCSKGCNIEVHQDHEIIYRYMPVFNEKVNGHWMCDEGRTSYHTYTDPQRIMNPLLSLMFQQKKQLMATSWETVSDEITAILKVADKSKIVVVVGTDATIEEMGELQNFASKNKLMLVSYNGTNGVQKASDDKKLDHLLRMLDKTPNTQGAELLKINPAPAQLSDYELVFFFRFGRAAVPQFNSTQKVVLGGVWHHEELQNLAKKNVSVLMVLPGLATVEKSGTYINTDGIKQNFSPAVQHLGSGVSVQKILGMINF